MRRQLRRTCGKLYGYATMSKSFWLRRARRRVSAIHASSVNLTVILNVTSFFALQLGQILVVQQRLGASNFMSVNFALISHAQDIHLNTTKRFLFFIRYLQKFSMNTVPDFALTSCKHRAKPFARSHSCTAPFRPMYILHSKPA